MSKAAIMNLRTFFWFTVTPWKPSARTRIKCTLKWRASQNMEGKPEYGALLLHVLPKAHTRHLEGSGGIYGGFHAKQVTFVSGCYNHIVVMRVTMWIRGKLHNIHYVTQRSPNIRKPHAWIREQRSKSAHLLEPTHAGTKYPRSGQPLTPIICI